MHVRRAAGKQTEEWISCGHRERSLVQNDVKCVVSGICTHGRLTHPALQKNKLMHVAAGRARPCSLVCLFSSLEVNE